MPNFENNFGTALTSDQIAGVTTTPINAIPTVDAPYYIALDATNANGHYEVVYVTSDTATNINHAATTYAHTTAEEVRLVLPASYLTAMQELEEGGMRNGKISVTVASNNLTVALKTQDGGDPSVTEPVFVKIGGTLRTITSALTTTRTAGGNYFNSGSVELATKEIDYFAYLIVVVATGAVSLGFSRIPYGTLGSEFSSTGTNEKWLHTSSGFNATDIVVNIGRFAATLSAGAGYTWSVPTFTATNLIQRPIYETRWLTWLPSGAGYTAGGAVYKLNNNTCNLIIDSTANITGNSSTPMAATNTVDNQLLTSVGTAVIAKNTSTITVASNPQNISGFYEI